MLAGERIHGWHRLEADKGTKIFWCGGQEVAIGAHDLGAMLCRIPEDRAGEHVLHLVGTEHEAGDDTEIAAAAAQSPEQVRILCRARGPETTVGCHDVGGNEIVDGQSTLPCEVARAAAQGQPAHAGGRDDAEGYGEAEGMGGVVDIARGTAGFDANGPRGWVDMHALHTREVDDQAILDAAQARTIVAAAANGDVELVVASEIDGGDDVGDVGAAGDQPWMLVDHAVVKLARFLVVRISAPDDRAAHGARKTGDGIFVHGLLPMVAIGGQGG